MEKSFLKLCQKYISNDEKTINKLLKKKLTEKDKKALKYIVKLQKKVNKMGFKTDFGSFCEMLEVYISKKDEFQDKEKSNYLKLLLSMSKIYEVDLREELEKYKIAKENDSQKDIENKLFYLYCRYNLQNSNTEEEFNNLKEQAVEQNLDYEKIQKNSLIFVEEIKLQAEKLGYSITDNLFNKVLNDYLLKKANLVYQEKVEYLKLLLYLSEIYEINLRQVLQDNNLDTIKKEDISISNPLENEELLRTLLVNRYENGYFDISNLFLPSDKLVVKSKLYDYGKMQADLTHKLYSIFVSKINNYAFEELNDYYAHLISEEELSRLNTLSREEIYEIINLIKKKEPVNYIIRKYKLTRNLYKFIKESITNVTDIFNDKIGLLDNNLFKTIDLNNNITIYINGPQFETNLLLNEYIRKCVLNNVNYELKVSFDLDNFNEENWTDTLLFANQNDLKIKLSILDEIANKYHEWIKSFGTPLKISSTINNSFYGISFRHVEDLNIPYELSYIEFFNNLCEVAYYRVLAKIVIAKIEDEKAIKIIEDFINLCNVTFKNDSPQNLIEADYNKINFTTIKDLINQYIPLISNIFNTYIEQSNKKDTIIEEFKKSLQYLFNITQGEDKKEVAYISLTKDIYNILKKVK